MIIYFVTWYDTDYDDNRGGDYPVNSDGSTCHRLEIPDTFYGRKRLAQEAADRFNQRPNMNSNGKRKQLQSSGGRTSAIELKRRS